MAELTSVPIELRLPLGGLNERFGYVDQPPQTTPDALNVWPVSPLEGRQRGGSRPGTVKAFVTQLPGTIQCLTPVTYLDTLYQRKTALVAVAAGGFYRSVNNTLVSAAGFLATENNDLLITEAGDNLITGGHIASTTSVIHAVERGGKLYVADYGVPVVTGTGRVKNGNEMHAPVHFSRYPIDASRDMIYIQPTTGENPAAGFYEIGSVSDYVVTLATASLTEGNCTYAIRPGIKVYDPTTQSFSLLTATKGIVPPGCPLICRYRDRIVLAGPDHIWYMSRQSDPTDWDYGTDPEDPGRAVAATDADAGMIGEPITALIPHSDDFLIFGCENSLWVMRGDPAFGGQLDCLSTEIGVVNATSWCKLPDASTLILSRGGLYWVPAGAQGIPERFSKEIVPRRLLNVNASSYITMAYNTAENGIHLSITPSSGVPGDHWWISWSNKSFWPIAFWDRTHQPTVVTAYASDPAGGRYILLASFDGYIRQFLSEIGNDDGAPIESHICLGPYRLTVTDASREGQIISLSGVLDCDSAQVNWGLVVGDTAEEVVVGAACPTAAGVWAAGASNTEYPRVRGNACLVRIGHVGVERWAFESIVLHVRPLGRRRP